VSSDSSAPFIPESSDVPSESTRWRIFGTPVFFRLWLAQVISSTGDWIGLIAILAIASRISGNAGTAVSLVMLARVVPGFFLGTVGGVLIDRFDRRMVMVVCDLARASLLLTLPFVDNLFQLVLVSFGLEVLTLLWGPAKDAALPNIVPADQLKSANSLSLVASYATFPLASLVFALLASLAGWLGSLGIVSSFDVDREALALFVDSFTFLFSALIVFRLPIPNNHKRHKGRIDLTQTVRDMKEGLVFIKNHQRVRAIVIGLGIGLIGAGAMIPLGATFAEESLGGDAATFGVLMTALGMGAAAGVISLLLLQKRLPRETVFEFAVMGTGAFLIIAVSFSSPLPAVLAVFAVGACAGTAYVTGFTVLQETVRDELRGRTFATLYAVIRMCLLISLVFSPLWVDFWAWFIGLFSDSPTAYFGSTRYVFSGVRLALWGGGLMTLGAGIWAHRVWARSNKFDSDPTVIDSKIEDKPTDATS